MGSIEFDSDDRPTRGDPAPPHRRAPSGADASRVEPEALSTCLATGPGAKSWQPRNNACEKHILAATLGATAMSLAPAIAAGPLPWAATYSAFQFELSVVEPGGPSAVNAASLAPAALSASEVAVVLHTDTLALNLPSANARTATTPDATADPPFSGHIAYAFADTDALNAPTIPTHEDAGLLLTQITANHATLAEAVYSGPLFSRAMASTEASWSGQLQTLASPLLVPDQSPAVPSLDLRWDFTNLSIATQSMNALAGISHVVQVAQYGADASRVDRIGFTMQLLNGVPYLTAQSTADGMLSGWLAQNLRFNQSSLGVDTTQGAVLEARLPLLAATPDRATTTDVVVTLDHQEFASETPPSAVPQLGASAGLLAHNRDPAGTMIAWDPTSNSLHIDPIPIHDLAGQSSPVGGVPVAADDPVYGGELQIDPLAYLGELAGLRYFSGSRFELRSAQGDPLLIGAIPTMVFDPALYDRQGFSFFSPVMTLLDTSLQRSAWLNSFLTGTSFSSPTQAQLFIGTPLAGSHSTADGASIDWQQPFAVPAYGVLGFAGLASDVPTQEPMSAISAPASATLMLLGLAALVMLRESARGALD